MMTYEGQVMVLLAEPVEYRNIKTEPKATRQAAYAKAMDLLATGLDDADKTRMSAVLININMVGATTMQCDRCVDPIIVHEQPEGNTADYVTIGDAILHPGCGQGLVSEALNNAMDNGYSVDVMPATKVLADLRMFNVDFERVTTEEEPTVLRLIEAWQQDDGVISTET